MVMRMDKYFLDQAYKEAVKAMMEDEVPIGAVIVRDGKIIARAHNKKEFKNDATAHAEIECIRKASKKINNWYLKDCALYVTLEPCSMCVGALINSRVDRVVFGARDLKGGALGGLFDLMDQTGFNHYFEYEYFADEKCGRILSDYFKEKRKKNKEN